MYGSGLGVEFQTNLPPSTHERNTAPAYKFSSYPPSNHSFFVDLFVVALQPTHKDLSLVFFAHMVYLNGDQIPTTYSFHPPRPLHPFCFLTNLDSLASTFSKSHPSHLIGQTLGSSVGS